MQLALPLASSSPAPVSSLENRYEGKLFQRHSLVLEHDLHLVLVGPAHSAHPEVARTKLVGDLNHATRLRAGYQLQELGVALETLFYLIVIP